MAGIADVIIVGGVAHRLLAIGRIVLTPCQQTRVPGLRQRRALMIKVGIAMRRAIQQAKRQPAAGEVMGDVTGGHLILDKRRAGERGVDPFAAGCAAII